MKYFVLLLFILITYVHSNAKQVHHVKNAHIKKKPLRLLNGRDSQTPEYPFIARMELQAVVQMSNYLVARNIHVCTCSIISPVWALTAGHCIMSVTDVERRVPGSQGVIRYGLVTNTPFDKDTMSVIESYHPHPDYFSAAVKHAKMIMVRNDIGLMKMNEISLPEYGRIGLADYTSLYGYSIIVAGFGLTNSSEGMRDTLALKKPLQVFEVVAMKCDASLKNRMYPGLCVAQRCGQAMALCPGDSGGPAMRGSRIVALTSLTYMADCASSNLRTRPNAVGFLTPISIYADWIMAKVGGG